MAKISPAVEHDRSISEETQKSRDFLKKDLMGGIEGDIADRMSWTQKIAHFQRRRYAQEWRDPEDPWPGSSELVMPLIDKKIDELKPSYVNLLTASKPPVTALALDKESQDKTWSIEYWFEFLIKFASPRFVEEVVYAVDDLLETGRGILKTIWHYQTRVVPETIRPGRLPFRLREMAVRAGSEEEAQALQMALQASGRNGAALTKKDFDQLKPAIEEAVAQEFDLDPDERRDARALGEIVSWLRGGMDGPLTIEKRDVLRNVPGVRQVSSMDLIVPSVAQDIEDAERIAHVMWFTEPELRARSLDAGWKKSAVDEFLKKSKKGDTARRYDEVRLDEDLRSGVSTAKSQVYEVWEVCHWYSSREGGPDRKAVALFSPFQPEMPFKWTYYTRPSGDWPYRSAVFERNKKGWYSVRGIPEKLSDIDAEITFQHRAKLNLMEIALSPSFFFNPLDPSLNPQNMRWTPGGFYPTRNPQSVQKIEMGGIDPNFEREEQILRTWAEEYLGSPDFGLSNPLSRLNEPRTATEIQSITARANQSLSLRGLEFQRMMQGVYHDMFDLWHTFGPDEVWVRVMRDQEPIRLTREELQGRFAFQVTGTIGEVDPQLEAQKALARLQLLMQVKQLGLIDDTHELDLGAAIEDWLEKDDVRAKVRIVRRRSPEETQAIRQQRQQDEELQRRAITNQPMTPEEMEEALSLLGRKAPHGKMQQVRA